MGSLIHNLKLYLTEYFDFEVIFTPLGFSFPVFLLDFFFVVNKIILFHFVLQSLQIVENIRPRSYCIWKMTTHSMHGSSGAMFILISSVCVQNAVSAKRNVFIPLLYPSLFLSFSRNRSLTHTHDHHVYSLGLRERTEALDLHYFMILLFSLFFFKFFKEKIILSIHLMQGSSPRTYNHVTVCEHLE